VMHKHGTDSEACLNRHIFTNCVKKKAMKDFCERPRSLIHKILLSEDLDTLNYKDVRNISKNMHSIKHAPPNCFLSQHIEETGEALSAVQVRKNNFCLLTTRKKYFNVFLQTQLAVS
jgi:hypothetical protein